MQTNEVDPNNNQFKQLDSNEEIAKILREEENPKGIDFETFKAMLENENQKDKDSRRENGIIGEITKLVYDSQTAMERRLMFIEYQDQLSETERKVNEVDI